MIDFFSDGARRDPYPLFELARNMSPVETWITPK